MKQNKYKIQSKEAMTIWIKDYNKEKFEQSHLVRANKIEFVNNHLMFYLGKELVFKVWLIDEKWQEYRNIEDALKNVGINVFDLEIK